MGQRLEAIAGNSKRALELIDNAIAAVPKSNTLRFDLYRDRARLLITLEYWDQAKDMVNRLVNDGLAKGDEGVEEVRILDQQIRNGLGRPVWEGLSPKDKETFAVRLQRGKRATDAGKVRAAINNYTLALELRVCAEAYVGRGAARLKRATPKANLARADAWKAIRLDPTLAEAHYVHSTALFMVQEPEAALHSAKKAVDLDPDVKAYQDARDTAARRLTVLANRAQQKKRSQR
jgi:tetratricopeptide (TPR) repeat protein